LVINTPKTLQLQNDPKFIIRETKIIGACRLFKNQPKPEQTEIGKLIYTT